LDWASNLSRIRFINDTHPIHPFIHAQLVLVQSRHFGSFSTLSLLPVRSST
jgi:hypothetical protein